MDECGRGYEDHAILPDLSHLTTRHFAEVYEPSDDTFLLLDALHAHLPQLRALAPAVCVEIGTGSGAVLTWLAQNLGPTCVYFGCERTTAAARTTLLTATHNHCLVNVVQTDLVAALERRLFHSVDLLICNPPYVPTPPHEVGGDDIAAAWAGGRDGREVIDRLISRAHHILSPRGSFYLVVVEENHPQEVIRLLQRIGLSVECVASRTARNERLHVLLSRPCHK